MKRIALLLAIVVVGTATFAATPKTAPAAAPAAAQSSGFTAVALTTGGIPLVKMGMGSWSLDLGATIGSPAAGTTNYTVIAKGDLPLGTVGQVRTYWAPQLTLASFFGASTVTGTLFVGGEYLFAPKLAIYGDLSLLSIASAAGATTWTIGTNVWVYSGIRMYL